MQSPVLRNGIERPVAPTSPDGAYRSRMMERYLWFLAKCEKPQVLDVGPIIGSTIDFFLSQASKLTVCDVLRRLGPSAQSHIQGEQLLSFFDYKPETFDGINLWDIPDHLENKVLTELIKRCSSMLKPNGLLMMLASNTSLPQPHPLYLASGENFTATLRKVTAMRLPYYFRSNRDIDLFMKPLEQYSSFVCMNGIREFLFRRQ